MNRKQIIDAIQRHNPTASARFLASFALRDLRSYLRRLESRRQISTLRHPTAWKLSG